VEIAMPRATQQLAELQNECRETVKALNKLLDDIAGYQSSSDTALDDFKVEAKKLEDKIVKTAKVKDISAIGLPEITAHDHSTPIVISFELYLSFEVIYDLYKKYEELCNIHTDRQAKETSKSFFKKAPKKNELAVEVDRAKKVVEVGLATLDRIRKDGQTHEENWEAITNGEHVDGVAEISNMRNLAFDEAPEFTVDYKEQLVELIRLLIKKYETAAELCRDDVSASAHKKFSREDVLAERVNKLNDFLEDQAHLLILELALNLNITEFYTQARKSLDTHAGASQAGGRGNRHFKIGIPKSYPLVTNLSLYYDYERLKLREMTKVAESLFPPKTVPDSRATSILLGSVQQDYGKNATDLTRKINGIKIKSEECTRYMASLMASGGNDKTIANKIFFLEISLGIYKKALQKYSIAGEICSSILDLSKDLGQEWQSLKDTMQEKDSQVKMMKHLESALNTLLESNVDAPLVLPQELGNIAVALWKLGALALSLGLPLEETVVKLKKQAKSLNISPLLLSTPTHSRPPSVVAELRHSIIEEDTQRRSVLLSPAAASSASSSPASADSFSAHMGTLSFTSSQTSSPRASVMILVAEVNAGSLHRAKTIAVTPSRSSDGVAQKIAALQQAPAPASTPVRTQSPRLPAAPLNVTAESAQQPIPRSTSFSSSLAEEAAAKGALRSRSQSMAYIPRPARNNGEPPEASKPEGKSVE
jgi:hypothetical protein